MDVVFFHDAGAIALVQRWGHGANGLEKEIHADGKIRSKEEPCFAFRNQFLDIGNVLVPASGSHNQRHAAFHTMNDVGDHHERRGEVDHHIGLPAYFTSANLARSAAMAAMDSLESTVSDTLTSEVETISTGQRWLAKTSKMLFRKPCAINMRVATTSTTVMRFLAAIALNTFLLLGAVAVMRVPSFLGLREVNMSTWLL